MRLCAASNSFSFHLIAFNLLTPRKPDNHIIKNKSVIRKQDLRNRVYFFSVPASWELFQLFRGGLYSLSFHTVYWRLGLLILDTWMHFPFTYGSSTSVFFSWNFHFQSQSCVVYFTASAHRAIWGKATGLTLFSFRNIWRAFLFGDGGRGWESLYIQTHIIYTQYMYVFVLIYLHSTYLLILLLLVHCQRSCLALFVKNLSVSMWI